MITKRRPVRIIHLAFDSPSTLIIARAISVGRLITPGNDKLVPVQDCHLRVMLITALIGINAELAAILAAVSFITLGVDTIAAAVLRTILPGDHKAAVTKTADTLATLTIILRAAGRRVDLE